MIRIDFEVVIAEIVALLQANLNTKIAAINSEKSDGINCQTIDNTSGYAVISLDDKNMNADPFCAVLIEEIATNSLGPAAIHELTLAIIIVKENIGEDPTLYKRMLRYMRAVSEVLETNFSSGVSGGPIKIKSLAPARLVALNSSNSYMGSGVSISLPVSS